jgi:predicted amidohydrolase
MNFSLHLFHYNPIIELNKEKMSLAICADIMNRQHPENAGKAGSTVYISSIFFSPEGIIGGHRLLKIYARKHSMNVLMSNYCGEVWGSPAGGRSAFWNKEGDLVAEINGTDPGLLLVEKNNGTWTGRILTFSK